MELKHRGKASTLSVVSFISFLFIFFDPYLPSQARDNFDFWPLSISLDNRWSQSEAKVLARKSESANQKPGIPTVKSGLIYHILLLTA